MTWRKRLGLKGGGVRTRELTAGIYPRTRENELGRTEDSYGSRGKRDGEFGWRKKLIGFIWLEKEDMGGRLANEGNLRE